MKRSLFLFFAALVFPPSTNADTVWLVYGAQHSSVHRGSVIDKIAMKNEEQCLAEGPKLEFLIRPSFMSNDDYRRKVFDDVSWGCIKGK